jgi:tetratricopeptide (TPR) repeat protein
MAAAALAKTGKTEQALKVLHAIMDKEASDDRDYQLLIELKGMDALPRLEELTKRDRFEERPLIWKAHLLRKDGQLDQALLVIKQAIAIDPSDGEQGPGRRMRAYAVLADILTDRGEQEEAAMFQGAMRAIRMSERADQFYAAGLLRRALTKYEQALTIFADAYCIQSRIALRMAELGLLDEASKHYQRAFELMPDSFGRIESHCFGCEGAFQGSIAQSIADRVFTDRLGRTPDKPQVHYLLGYLREQQGRYPKALAHYQQAVTLDRDYYNAWSKLTSMASHIHIPSTWRDQASLSQLRLDPLGRHGHPSLNKIRDLRQLWNAVQTASKYKIEQVEQVYLLKAVPKKETSKIRTRSAMSMYIAFNRPGSSAQLTPGSVIAKHQAVISACQLYILFISKSPAKPVDAPEELF